MTEVSQQRRQWVAMLAKLVAPMDATAAAKALAGMLPLLVSLPDAAFTMRSLEAIAADMKRTPTYAELRAALLAWWAANRPEQTLALPDNVVGLSEKDRVWLAYWHERERDGFAPLRGPDGRLTRPDVTDWQAHTASMVRQYAPAAWLRIAGDQDQSEETAA